MTTWKQDKLFLSYLAGFVDGEGTISISRRTRDKQRGWFSYDPYLSIVDSDIEVMKYIKDRIGFGSLRLISKSRLKKRAELSIMTKPCYGLWFPNEKGRELIKALLPYLRVKANQARLVLDMPIRGKSRDPITNGERQRNQEYVYGELKMIHGRNVN